MTSAGEILNCRQLTARSGSHDDSAVVCRAASRLGGGRGGEAEASIARQPAHEMAPSHRQWRVAGESGTFARHDEGGENGHGSVMLRIASYVPPRLSLKHP